MRGRFLAALMTSPLLACALPGVALAQTVPVSPPLAGPGTIEPDGTVVVPSFRLPPSPI